MSSLSDFLSHHPEIAAGGSSEEPPEPYDRIVVEGILIAAGPDNVHFGHLGTRFLIRSEDILDVQVTSSAIPNQFGTGVPVRLAIRSTSRVTRSESMAASELTRGLPFAMARPSLMAAFNQPPFSEQEHAWMAQRGIVPAARADGSTTTYCGTQSPKWSSTQCTTYSDGYSDDNRTDDGNNDEYYTDDSQADDLSAD